MFFLFFVLVPLLVVSVPTAMWFTTWRSAWDRWLPRVVGTENVGQGQYRDVALPRLRADGPPMAVRAAVLGCWALGTMFVPGLLLGLSGLAVVGLGLISIPGLILAAQLFRLGTPLLHAEPAAAAKARSLARSTRVLNYVVVALCSGALVIYLPDVVRRGVNTSAIMGVTLALAVALYAGVSFVHAALLIRSAEAIEAQQPPAAVDLTGLRIGALAGDVAPPQEDEDAARAREERDALTR